MEAIAIADRLFALAGGAGAGLSKKEGAEIVFMGLVCGICTVPNRQ